MQAIEPREHFSFKKKLTNSGKFLLLNAWPRVGLNVYIESVRASEWG